jgi:hypothetical protein
MQASNRSPRHHNNRNLEMSDNHHTQLPSNKSPLLHNHNLSALEPLALIPQTT